MLILTIVSATFLIGLSVAVAIEQADSRRGDDFDLGKKFYERYWGVRPL